MAKFVVSMVDGKYTPFLEGKDGEEISADMVAAYAQMNMAWALGEIADRLVGLDNSLNAIADALEK